MSGITPFLANQILNQIFRNSGFAHVPLKVSLHTADPGETGANELIPAVPPNQSLFAERTTIASEDWNAASGGEITNSESIVMGVLPQATVTHVGFQTKKQFGDPGSKLLFSFELEEPVVLSEDFFNIFSFEPGDLIVRFSALTGTHVTEAFANRLLDMICRGDYPALQIRASLHDGDPGETGTNQISGSSYFRYPLPARRWTIADLGSIRNIDRILWPNLPEAEVTHMGFWSLSTFLMSKEFVVSLAAHDALVVAKNALEINLSSAVDAGPVARITRIDNMAIGPALTCVDAFTGADDDNLVDDYGWTAHYADPDNSPPPSFELRLKSNTLWAAIPNEFVENYENQYAPAFGFIKPPCSNPALTTQSIQFTIAEVGNTSIFGAGAVDIFLRLRIKQATFDAAEFKMYDLELTFSRPSSPGYYFFAHMDKTIFGFVTTGLADDAFNEGIYAEVGDTFKFEVVDDMAGTARLKFYWNDELIAETTATGGQYIADGDQGIMPANVEDPTTITQ